MIDSPSINVSDIEFQADTLDVHEAAAAYQEHGCLVVRGLMKPYVDEIRADIMRRFDLAMSLYDKATKNPNGWGTPDGTLWIPAPKSFTRDKQIMVVSCSYMISSAFLRSTFHTPTLDLAEAVLGPNIELFMNGQCLVKEPVGGHPKNLHQDGAYFEHRFEGPFAMLNYAVDTSIERGALYVVPGSHKLGILKHVDTLSHLGLDDREWPWEKALPIEGEAGDSIFFHVKTIHGSKPNYTDQPRPVFIHRYRAANDFITVSATNVADREKADKVKEQATKENQHGFMVRGVRPFETQA